MVEDPEIIIRRWFVAESFIAVGKSLERVDSIEKVLGRARFVEDFFEEGFLVARLALARIPHARIRKISYDHILKNPKVHQVLTYRDIPGENQVGYAIPDQPLLAERKVRYYGEPVAVVVGRDPDTVNSAVEEVVLDVDPLPALYNSLEAMERQDILVHEALGTNIAFKTRVRKGDVDSGFSKADVVVENTYRTHHQEHAYLEPEAALAIPDLENRITVIATIQYPHLGQKIVAKVLGIPSSYVKIVAPYIGGGFGGKDDEGPLVAARAALAAYHLRRPVLLYYTREDSMQIHPKREATVIRYKSGATQDGKLTAIEVTIVHDTGAYANRGPFILWRATMHSSGPYYVPNAKIDGYCVYTNKVPQGSFRGFGNPSVQFAAEAQMDQLAEKLGFDPIDLRLINMLRPSSETITGQMLMSSVGIYDALKKLASESNWRIKRRMYEESRAGRFRRGIGVAVGWHGNSTSRAVPDWSNSYIHISRDGSVSVYTGIVEIGQGSPSSSHRQLVAEVLGCPFEKVNIVFGTTDAPDTGATHASRGTSVGAIGILVAAGKIRSRLESFLAEYFNVQKEEIKMSSGEVVVGDKVKMKWEELIALAYSKGVDLSATGYFFLPKGVFNDEVGQGFAYPAFSFIAVVAEVEVDTFTGKVRVLEVHPALAVGKVINPEAVKTQVEGAIVQGLGYTLMEKLVISEDGRIINDNLTDYVIPTSHETPVIREAIFVEDLWEYGPFGAKGVGEMAFIPMPAAIANALSHALGIRVTELPLTLDKVYSLTRDSSR
ncbi:MAG: xanthine dehydrogenase family protein molybdopterin-binding subunit [Sulfolobales archaeon]|nr:xanthine dehydrogenase family protein molybdopterin-binding subunit [Sulfolobales archaeon]MDW8083443.1 xanthine dehydrogenase family protein molybdopterin-binding subunit [Sulfolobales archaeon]